MTVRSSARGITRGRAKDTQMKVGPRERERHSRYGFAWLLSGYIFAKFCVKLRELRPHKSDKHQKWRCLSTYSGFVIKRHSLGSTPLPPSPPPLKKNPLPHQCRFRRTKFKFMKQQQVIQTEFTSTIVLLFFSSSCICSSLTVDDPAVQGLILSKVLGSVQSECL